MLDRPNSAKKSGILLEMFGRVSFYPTLAYNIVLERLKFRPWFSRIDETVILGALPWKSISDKLIEEENVQGVVSMNEDFELKYWVPSAEEWKAKGVSFLQLNTADIFHAPTQEKIKQGVSFIEKFEEKQKTVYVHCKAGRTRSATLVGCYLMKKHSWDPNTAVEFMREKRSHILLHAPQWRALREFYGANVEKKTEARAK